MNEIVKIYNNQPVRIIQQNGEPWFVAKDVCDVLGLSQVSRALQRLEQDERGLLEITHPQNANAKLKVNVVSEPGLYQLITSSKKPEARAFTRWVTHEVLPSIRKTGAYIAPNFGVEALGKLFISIKEQCEQLIEENAIMRQKLEYALQFIPKTRYGAKSKQNGQRQTTIRRGANVAGNDRLIEHRDPDEVGYSMDLFGEYLPRLLLAEAVNIININCPKLLESANA